MVWVVSSILVVMLSTWEVRLNKAYSNLAIFMCSLMMSCVSGAMGFSHLHCIREWVFECGGGVVEGMPSADWGMKEFMG